MFYRRVSGELAQHVLPEAAKLHRAQQPATSASSSGSASVRSAGGSSAPSAEGQQRLDCKAAGQRLLAPAALRTGEGGATVGRRRGATDALLSHAIANGRRHSHQPQATHTVPQTQLHYLRTQPASAAGGSARRGARVRSARAQELAISLMQKQPASGNTRSRSAATVPSKLSSTSAAQLMRRAIERFAPEIGNEHVVNALLRGAQVASWGTYVSWLRKRCMECSLMSLFHDVVPISSDRTNAHASKSRPFMTQIDVSGNHRLEACVELMDRVSVKQSDGSLKRTYNAYMLIPEATALHTSELHSVALQLSSSGAFDLPLHVGTVSHTAPQNEQTHSQVMKMHASVLTDVQSALRPRYRHPYVTYSAAQTKLQGMHSRWKAAAACTDSTVQQGLNDAHTTEDVAESESLQTSRQSRPEGPEDGGGGSPACTDHTGQHAAQAVPESTVRQSAKETQHVRTQPVALLTGSVLGKTWAPSAARTDAASAAVRTAQPPKRTNQTRTTKYCELCRVDYEVVDGDRGAHFSSAAHQRRLHQTVLSQEAIGTHCILTAVTQSAYTPTQLSCKECSLTRRFVHLFVSEQVQAAAASLNDLLAMGAQCSWELRPDTLKRDAANAVFTAVDAWTQWAHSCFQGGAAVDAPGNATGLVADRALFWALGLRSKLGSSPHPTTILSLLGELQPMKAVEPVSQELSAQLQELFLSAVAQELQTAPVDGQAADEAGGPAQVHSGKENAGPRSPSAAKGSANTPSSNGSSSSSSSSSSSGSSSSGAICYRGSETVGSMRRGATSGGAEASTHSATLVDAGGLPASEASAADTECELPPDAQSVSTDSDAATDVRSVCKTAQSPKQTSAPALTLPQSPRRSPRRKQPAAYAVPTQASSHKTTVRGRRFARWRNTGMLSPSSAAAKHTACSSATGVQQRTSTAAVSSNMSMQEAASAPPPPAAARQGALVATASRSGSLTRAPRVNHRATSRAVVASKPKRRRSVPRVPSLIAPSARKSARPGGAQADATHSRGRMDSFELPHSPGGGSSLGFDSASPSRGMPSAPAQEKLRITRRRISAARGRDLASPPKAF